MTDENKQIRLAARPDGMPKPSDWQFTTEAIPVPGSGEVLVHNRFVSVDPTMRGWMDDRPGYLPVLPLGAVMRALTVGEVVESNHESFSAGDWVSGVGGVQDYAISDGSDLGRIDTALAPPEAYLNTLGIAGLTAYCGLMRIGKPKAGDTVLVSGAAGRHAEAVRLAVHDRGDPGAGQR
jgi:NADPH-dependent curcumin reductase CurA